MLIRLLYRLALQRLDERTPQPAPARSNEGIGIFPSSAGNRHVLVALAVVAVVGASAFAARFAMAPATSQAGGAVGGELRLVVTSVEPGPVVVYLRGAGLAPAGDLAGVDSIPQIVSVAGMFRPKFQVVEQGSVIEVRNEDSFLHNTHVFNRGDTVFNVATPLQGTVSQKAITGTGVLDVRCDLHPWMRAWIFVPPSAHFAVVHAATTVRFTGVAPGSHVLHLWQPRTSETLYPVALETGEVKTLRLR